MNASKNLYALVRAYDLFTADVASESEYRKQLRSFGSFIHPFEMALSPLFEDCRGVHHQLLQCRFDAAMSIAIDVGLDLFFLTELPDSLRRGAGVATLRVVLKDLPCFDSALQESLRSEMIKYGMPERTRRAVELDLYCGVPLFAVGRKCNADGNIVYGPFVMHPFLRFLSRARR